MSGPIQNGFQGVVNNQPAPGEAGDFCSANPRAVVIAGPGQFSAPASGLIVGRFAWVNTDTGDVSQSYKVGYQLGFLHRENNAIIVDFLSPATFKVLQGLPITLFSQGEFWAKFAAGAQPGQKVWADPDSGEAIAGSTAPNTASVTGDAGFVGNGSIGTSADGHGSAAAGVLTITQAPTSGKYQVGDTLSGTGVGAGVTITAQLTGTPGGAGTYQLNPGATAFAAATDLKTVSNVLVVDAVTQGALEVGSVVTGAGIAANSTVTAFDTGAGGVGTYVLSGAQQQVADEAIAAVTDKLNVSAVASGVIGSGDVIAGAGVTGGTQIIGQISGTPGGVGVYQITPAQEFASTALTVAAIATPFIVNSVAANGELAKISSWG